MKSRIEYERWLSSEHVDEDMKAALRAMDEKEIGECFWGRLAFGTAGLRGIMRPGTNAMNTLTVKQATRGLGEYLLAQGRGEDGVVIAHDSRNQAKDFALCAALVLAAMGIRIYLFEGMRPTPVLSFAIRHLKTVAGINITASHNPKEYNGYKAYYEDGAQLAPEQAAAVSEYIDEIDVFDVESADLDTALARGLVVMVGKEVDEAYFEAVLAQTVDASLFARNADMKFVYTPLHGAGRDFVPEVLSRVGMKNVITVEEQMVPDGDFPTVAFPNPEFPEVFAPGIALAQEHGCDLIIATDPDADRVGIMARSREGDFRTLSGNQVGCLLLSYIITSLKAKNALPSDAYAVKSIVTSELASKICAAHGVKMFDVLTGFKFIGEVIKKHEEKGEGTFLLGFEESYGYLKGTYARDKDAVVASLLIAEMAAFYREKGMTLIDAMEELYTQYGFCAERVMSVTMEGTDGAMKMKALMASLRTAPPTALARSQIVSVRDYLNGTITQVDGTVCETGLVPSDVLYFTAKSGATLVVRPSGTEPKVKFYVMTFGDSMDEAVLLAEAVLAQAKGLVK